MFQPFEKTGDIAVDIIPLTATLTSLRDSSRIANLANAAALLHWYLDDINWVGFYLWNEADDEMVLGPFQGLPACIRIAKGRGVCGKAAETGTTQIVQNVHEFPGHIACDSASRSELVVPLFHSDGRFLGVLDIDSPSTGRFNDQDAAAMETFCRNLAD